MSAMNICLHLRIITTAMAVCVDLILDLSLGDLFTEKFTKFTKQSYVGHFPVAPITGIAVSHPTQIITHLHRMYLLNTFAYTFRLVTIDYYCIDYFTTLSIRIKRKEEGKF